MALANLFTGLFSVEEKKRSRDEASYREEAGDGNRGRKRKKHGDSSGPPDKTQRCPNQTNNSHTQTRENGRSGFRHNHSDGAEQHNVLHRGQREKNKQKHKPKMEFQKNGHQQTGGRRRGRGGGGGGRGRGGGGYNQGGKDRVGGKRKDGKDVPAKPKFMTEEFKEQNALLVDGELLCRHFLFGRCIKGDECQLKHAQGHNNVFKEVCKFYVQGFCTKGTSCPYMHHSFPCKFFHTRGKCSQDGNCKFSHAPLDETTKILLDEALQRDSDLHELKRKAEQEPSSGQTGNTEQPESAQENRTAELPLPTLRPSFYNSSEAQSKRDVLLSEGEMTDAAVPPSDDAERHDPPPAESEPVCYSVEAVLGPQLYKPFSGCFATSGSGGNSSSAAQSQAPYAVDAVLSYESAGSSTFGRSSSSPPPPAHGVLYAPLRHIDEPLINSQTEKRWSCYKSKANDPPEQMSRSSVTNPKVPAAAECDERARGFTAAPPKAQVLSLSSTVSEKPPRNKRDLQGTTPVPGCGLPSVSCEREGVAPCPSTESKSQVVTPTHSTRLKTRLPVQTAKSQTPECDSGTSVTHQAATQQPTQTRPSLKKAQTSSRHRDCAESTEERGGTAAHCGLKSKKNAFYSLFANPIRDSLKSTPVSAPPPPDLIQPCAPPQSTPCVTADICVQTESDRPSDRAFLGLFAAPLDAALVKASDKQTASSKFSPSCKNAPDDASESVVGPLMQQVSLSPGEVSSSPTEADPSTARARRQPTDVSSPEGSVPSSSVLKTLFLCLSPFTEQQDRVCPETQRDHSSLMCDQQQQEGTEKRNKEKTPSFLQQQTTSERHFPNSPQHQPSSLQSSALHVEVTVGSTLDAAAHTHPLEESSASDDLLHDLLSKPSASHKLLSKPSASDDLLHDLLSKPSASDDLLHDLLSKPSASHDLLSKPSASHDLLSKPSASHDLLSKPSASDDLLHDLLSKPSASHDLLSKPSASDDLLHDILSKPSASHDLLHNLRSKPSCQPVPQCSGAGLKQATEGQRRTGNALKNLFKTLDSNVFNCEP